MEQATLRQEEVVYHITRHPDLYLSLIDEIGLNKSKTFDIARQYGCNVEFRPAQWKQSYDTNYLAPSGAREDGSCTAVVVVGEDREKVARARQDIRNTLGFKLHGGWVEVEKRRE